jgi:hypothetical protein
MDHGGEAPILRRENSSPDAILRGECRTGERQGKSNAKTKTSHDVQPNGSRLSCGALKKE